MYDTHDEQPDRNLVHERCEHCDQRLTVREWAVQVKSSSPCCDECRQEIIRKVYMPELMAFLTSGDTL